MPKISSRLLVHEDGDIDRSVYRISAIFKAPMFFGPIIMRSAQVSKTTTDVQWGSNLNRDRVLLSPRFCQDTSQIETKKKGSVSQLPFPVRPHLSPPSIITLVSSLSIRYGCIQPSFFHWIDKARWPGTKGFRKHPRKVERRRTLLEICIGWRNLLLSHSWRSHTC